MKYIQTLIIICLFISCSGTKKVIENKKSTKTKTTIKDTVKTEVIKITDSLYVPQDRNVNKIAEIPNKGPIMKSYNFTESFNHKTFEELLKKYVSEKGHVDYKGFKTDYKKLKNYISELDKNTPKNNWVKEDKLAYWINAYNAFTIDLILKHYPLESIKNIKNPWKQRYWKLDEKWYNLEDIEHEILRKMNEPRIHFAIVCASYSCPKLQNEAFTSSNMEQQLTKATKQFLSDPERNIISKNELELSRIFQWFSKDFKQNGSLIDFLNTYSGIKVSDKAKIKYKDYDWSLNK